jgi:hypothetical protein
MSLALQYFLNFAVHVRNDLFVIDYANSLRKDVE